MSEEQAVWQCDCVIPSRLGAGTRVQEQVLEQLERHRWGQRDVFSVRLAMEEALVNAIKHGNRSDSTKQVHIACRLFPERLWIQVTDEGRGFDPSQVSDPTDPANIESPCGRGIMLMRSFMSHVEFSPPGNRVVLQKERARTGESVGA
jgi:serine/threonine-protein kinase RsbW